MFLYMCCSGTGLRWPAPQTMTTTLVNGQAAGLRPNMIARRLMPESFQCPDGQDVPNYEACSGPRCSVDADCRGDLLLCI